MSITKTMVRAFMTTENYNVLFTDEHVLDSVLDKYEELFDSDLEDMFGYIVFKIFYGEEYEFIITQVLHDLNLVYSENPKVSLPRTNGYYDIMMDKVITKTKE